MRRGRRILAVAGMTALLLSNIGTATRTVFAEEQTGVIDPAAVTDETAGLQTQEVIEPQTPVESDTGSGEITAGEISTDGADVAAEAVADVPDAELVAEPTDETGVTGPTETPAVEVPVDENIHTEETPIEENTDAVEDTSDADDVNATEGETEIIDNTDTEVIDEEPEEEIDLEEEESDDEDLVLIEQTIEGKADDGASVEIVGNLPENAQARMEAVALDRDELDSYFGSDVVAGMDRLAVYDISIYVNDEEWEPNETVSVKVHNPDIQPIDGNAEPETEADTENIVVAHLDDGGEQIATYSDDSSAEFEIEGVPADETKDAEIAEPAKETSTSETTDETAEDATEPSSDETSAVTGDADTTEETEPAEETTPAEQSDENAETPAAETNTTDVVAEVLPSASTDGDVSFETDGFSLYGFYTYTVDFYYEETKSQFSGGSTFQLSQLLDELGIADSAEDVTDVTFTDTTLIEVVQEDNDWRLTSLLPFTTSETLTVTFADGTQITIRTEDSRYFSYTQSDNLTPFAGQILNSSGGNYIGKYDIFGGGNGIAARTSQNSDTGTGGSWRYNGTTWQYLKGYTVSASENTSASYSYYQDTFISSSEANINWKGNLEKAYISFGYYGGSGTGTIEFELFSENDTTNALANVTITLSSKSEDTDRPSGDVNQVDNWQYLTFDCTDLMKAQLQGNYIVKATVSKTSSRDNTIVADMGWSIYGITYDSSLDHNTAIVGRISEMKVTKDDKAEVTFSPSILPSGTGKVWYNVHGGEEANGNNDYDYLELKVQTKNGTDYVKFGDGTNGSVEVTTNGETWTTNDIAKPNTYQTATSGYRKFDNTFAFALGEYKDMNSVPVVGIRKRMADNDGGDDVYGSVLLLVDVKKSQGNPLITKRLSIPDTADNEKAGKDSDGNAISFQFKVEPVDNAPMPTSLTEKSNIYTLAMNESVYDSYEESGLLADFAGMNQFLNVTNTNGDVFKYKVTEVDTGQKGWSYDTKVRYLEYTVKPYNGTTVTQEITYRWVDENGDEIDDGDIFVNTYSSKEPVKTGVNTGAVPLVVFPAGMAFLALYRRTRRRFTH